MKDFEPFENEEQSVSIGPGNGLTFENGVADTNGIVIYGDFEVNLESNIEDLDNIIDLMTKIKNKLIELQSDNSNNKTIKP